MAEYQLSREEYKALGRRNRRPLSARIARSSVALVILLAIAGTLLYFGQWLLVLLLAAFVFFAEWYAPRYVEKDFYEKDAFQSGSVELTVEDEFIRLQANGVVFESPYRELNSLWEYHDHFVVYHSSGISAKVPKSPLSKEELRILSEQQARFPDIARRMSH